MSVQFSWKEGCGTVYYIGCPETLRIKIGFTRGNPYSRLDTLQTGSPTQLTMIAMHSDDMETERDLHAKFADYRLHGEWFLMSEEIFAHLGMIVWLQARQSIALGEPLERWVKVGLSALNEYGDLPADLEAAL